MRRSALVVVALLVGCTGGDEGDDDAAVTTTEAAPTTTEAVETTTTTAAPDPFTVPLDPADIDEAYVEAVLTELERINGDALRLAVSEGLSPRISALLESVFDPSQLPDEVDALVDESIAGFQGIRRPPGDVRVEVITINTASSECISIDGTLDFSAVAEQGTSAAATRIELRRNPGTSTANSTPWRFSVRDPLSDSAALSGECGSE